MAVNRGFFTACGVALLFGAASCAPVSTPVTEREKTAVIGGLAGGATGAIIGSMAGSAVAGGLFGIPLGAVAGWYVGDQYDIALKRDRERATERDSELERLRRENERLRRENDDIRRPSAQAPATSAAESQARVEQRPVREQQLSQSQPAPSVQREQVRREASVSRSSSGVSRASAEDIREAQRALNKMGFDAGSVDGVWGPVTAAAIRNFQQSRGIEVTGRLNDRTMEELGINGGPQAKR
jgi:hypothetical protein